MNLYLVVTTPALYIHAVPHRLAPARDLSDLELTISFHDTYCCPCLLLLDVRGVGTTLRPAEEEDIF